MSDLLSTFKEKPTDESLKDGCKQEGHDQSGNIASWDPAVLAMGPARRKLTYTIKELHRLRNSPLVKRDLENAFAGCEALALVLKKRPDSPNDDDRGAKGDAPNENHKGVYGRERRSADPRERVRKESACEGGGGAGGGCSGGIVLSPQRRSFTSGCGASVAAAPHQPPHVARTRPDSPLSQQQPAKQDQGRRIGSGRIMVRDENRSGWEEPEYRAEPYRPPLARERDRNADRYDRRSFTRDSYSSDIKRERDDRFVNDKPRDREDNRRSGGRFSQRRFEKDEEPEWMSGGPTSQLETIELRGFDEPIKKNGTSGGKENEKWNANGRGRSSDRDRWRSEPPPASPPAAPAQPKPAPKHHNSTHEKDPQPPPPVPEPKPEETQNNDHPPDFNLDDFLKFDIPEVLTNGTSEPAGSRFSRWFRKESPPTDKQYERYLSNMVDELDVSSRPEGVGGPPEGETGVFAPISPAARPPVSLLDLLRRANAADQRQEMNPIGGKMQSLEELEARMRQSAPPPHSDQDLTAFKRLLAQVSGGHAVPAAGEPARHPPAHSQPPPPHQAHPLHQPPPASHHQPMTLFQMLNKNVEQQPKVTPPQQPHIPQDLLYKLFNVQRQQQQQQQQQHQQQQQQQQQHQQQQEVGNVADHELLQRPEAQAILHGLKAGEITVQHLLKQLNNPGLQSRHREVLHTILRLQHQIQMGGSPLPGSGAPPHLVVPPHHQQLPISPLPHQGVPTRIPSSRELVAHTQSIMQGALIKKKLEEQKENYRRRHEMQHQAKQPTPISFTPTSVLRKMTADKESDVLSPKQQQWSQPPKMPQGRPIVKGNQSGAAPSMGYTPAPVDYQQHYLNHQQQMGGGGMRSYSLPQQRQQAPASMPSINNMNNINNITRGVAAGTTIHQLIVQTHQMSLNEMGVTNAAGGGGDNQLTRWFSPELLARASAGKLPSVHMPNALSLEDLERHHHSPAPPVRN